MKPGNLNHWAKDPPPAGTVVLASYTPEGLYMRVRVLPDGKYVEAGIGPMELPRYWYPTDDQAAPLHSERSAAPAIAS